VFTISKCDNDIKKNIEIRKAIFDENSRSREIYRKKTINNAKTRTRIQILHPKHPICEKP